MIFRGAEDLGGDAFPRPSGWDDGAQLCSRDWGETGGQLRAGTRVPQN